MKKDSYYEELEQKGYYKNIDKRSKDYREYKSWKANKIETSYKEVKSNIDKSNENRGYGVGDLVAKGTKALGIKKVVEAITDDCGCDERQKNWNEIRIFKGRKVNCIDKPDYIYLKDLFDSKRSYRQPDKIEIYRIYNKLFNTRLKLSGCDTCTRRKAEELKKYIKIWEQKQ